MEEPSEIRPGEKAEQTVVPSYAWVILFVALLAGVTALLNQFKVPSLMPVLMQRFQLDLGTAGLLMTIFAITGFILALPAGVILTATFSAVPEVMGKAQQAGIGYGSNHDGPEFWPAAGPGNF